MEFEQLTISLPKGLADWVRECAKAYSMSPDQLITRLLEQYRESWNIGRRALWQEITEGIRNSCIENTGKWHKGLIRKFNQWLDKRYLVITPENLNDIDSLIASYLEEYRAQRGIKTKTLSGYRSTLRKYMRCVLDRLSVLKGISLER